MFVADLHAHLTRTEIIGFLAGRYDAAAGGTRNCCVFATHLTHTLQKLPSQKHSRARVSTLATMMWTSNSTRNQSWRHATLSLKRTSQSWVGTTAIPSSSQIPHCATSRTRPTTRSYLKTSNTRKSHLSVLSLALMTRDWKTNNLLSTGSTSNHAQPNWRYESRRSLRRSTNDLAGPTNVHGARLHSRWRLLARVTRPSRKFG